MFSHFFPRHVPLILCLLALSLSTGCANYTRRSSSIIDSYQAGQFAAAASQAVIQTQEHAKDHDRLIWRLEEATLYRAAGFQDPTLLDKSTAEFDAAEQIVEEFEQMGDARVGQGAIGLATNQATLDYPGYAYDKIMIDIYSALNYLHQNQLEKARVELNAALDRQRDAVEKNAQRIEEAQKKAQSNDKTAPSKEQQQVDQAKQDPRFNQQLEANYANLKQLKAYGDYVNPFAVYLDALAYMTGSGSDLERARKSFERVHAMVGDAPFILQDRQALDDLVQKGTPLGPVTYVIFETGLAPTREEIRIDIPVFLPNLPYTGASFPKLVMQNDHCPSLTISAANTSPQTTTTVASMDSIVGREFENLLPEVIARTLTATIAKAAASYAANQSTQNNMYAHLGTQLLTTVYQASMNEADLRTWRTLPKEFQVARIPTPANRQLTIAPASTTQPPQTITINSGTINIIYVKSVNNRTPLLISQFKLQ